MSVLLVELNELNLNYVQDYLNKNNFKNLEKVIKNVKITTSEKSENFLEPWIQWHSIHTGLTASEHGVFRLGDSINCKCSQIFEELESEGFSVGSISAMNATNRLNRPVFFIPDPWTKTKSDSSFFSKIITQVLSDFVNNNASGKYKIKNIFFLILIFLKFVRCSKYYLFLKMLLKSFFGKWRRALFLDMLIHEIHLNLIGSKKPDFSAIFFNAGAHIQHHYLLNSLANKSEIKNPDFVIKNNQDPFEETLYIYEDILEDYFKRYKNIIIATGLTQSIVKKPHYYYRLVNHDEFLNKLNIKFLNVQPRMSRDFLVNFENNFDRDQAYETLNNISISDKKLFEVLDKRKNSLFVTLTYDMKIIQTDELNIKNNKKIKIFNEVVFVAIKNGYHNGQGFLFASGEILKFFEDKEIIKIIEIKNRIKNFFKIK